MIIKSLELTNFRNYNTLEIDFSDKVNILYGDNAQGKTNILEALCLCATTKSQKGSRDKEMIQLGKEEAHIRMYVVKGGVEHKLDMHLRKGKAKSAALDGVPVRKSSELYGMVHVISFSPEDLGIIKEGPAERRRMVDMELCQLDKIYLHGLIQYNRVLEQRNNLLKQISLNRRLADTLPVWDEQLAQYGAGIIKARQKFIRELMNWLARFMQCCLEERNYLCAMSRAFCRMIFCLVWLGTEKEKFCRKVRCTDLTGMILAFILGGMISESLARRVSRELQRSL